MKKIICAIILTSMLLLCFAACDSEETPNSDHLAPSMANLNFSSTSSIENIKKTDEPTNYVLIEVSGYGSILVRLFPNVAPKTVENFKSLVEDDFYDGIIFHRVINGFMIQGGDPDGNGLGGSEKTIVGEFSNNGFTNNLSHIRGVISMARNGYDMNSASSQFFIVQQNTTRLDGDYASFGYVVYGMDVVDDIAKATVDRNDKPGIDIVIREMSFADVSDINFDIT